MHTCSQALLVSGTIAIGNDIPTFIVVSPRADLETPSIEVIFPNGFHDELELFATYGIPPVDNLPFVLTQYKIFKDSKEDSNYIGYLKNTPGSSVAVTGHLNEPTDRMEITLLS